MANYCGTRVALFGNKNEVERLATDLEKMKEVGSGAENWLGRILILNGMECNDVAMKFDSRAFVEKIDEKNDFLELQLECAGRPTMDLFQRIADIYSLDFECIASEPGNKVFLNTDITGKYFPLKYQLRLVSADSFMEYEEGEVGPGNSIRWLFEMDVFDSAADDFLYDCEMDFEASDLENILKAGRKLFRLSETTTFEELAAVIEKKTNGELLLVKYAEKLCNVS